MQSGKGAVVLADSRSCLVGNVLLQLQEKNDKLFDEAIIYYIKITDDDKRIMNSIMPCRFIEYNPPLPKSLFRLPRFRLFSILMFARYELFNLLKEYSFLIWIDTDVLIQDNLEGLIKEAHKSGYAMLREDPENKSSYNPDYMRQCFFSDLPKYNLDAYLYASGTIVVTNKLLINDDYTSWCYSKTIEFAHNLVLPDQGILNALIQEFYIPAVPLNMSKYACYPYYGRDTSNATIIHTWGNNKFWNDFYLYKKYPAWNYFYKKWLDLGGSSLLIDFAPRVSVIIPVHKPNLKWFKEMMDSLVNQKRSTWERYSDFEIIIISEPVENEQLIFFINGYNDNRITLIINDKMEGISASLNKGIKLAKGEYIARCDSDDIVNEMRLYRQVQYLDENENVSVCTTNFHYFGDMNESREMFEGEMSKAWSIFTCPFDHPTIMFRKSFFIGNNLFYDETRKAAEDWELWLRAFDVGMNVGCIKEYLYLHRWHKSNEGQSNNTIKMMHELVQYNFSRLDVFVSEDILPYVGPWNGMTNDVQYKRLKRLFSEALRQNKKILYYNQKNLVEVFKLRLREAKTGRFSINKSSFFSGIPDILKQMIKKLLKRCCRPLYEKLRDFKRSHGK